MVGALPNISPMRRQRGARRRPPLIAAVAALLIALSGVSPPLAAACILCTYRTPPMPEPLDQIQLPSAEVMVDLSEELVKLCANRTRLQVVGDECRTEVTRLVCAFYDFTKAYQAECPSREDTPACVACERERARVQAATAWIPTWIDSFGKMPAGISEGNYHWLGDYEQCQGLKKAEHFAGRYCLVDFAIPSTTSTLACNTSSALEVSLGACLPASCSSDENRNIVQEVTRHPVHVRCEARDAWSTGSLVFAGVASAWLGALLLATLLHWSAEPSHLTPLAHELVNALSLQQNAADAMRTKRLDTHDFRAAPGIQVISVIVLVSSYAFYLMMPYLENQAFAYETSQRFVYQPLINFSFHVDALLALSALRLATKPTEKFGSLRLLGAQLLRRFARTWPAFAALTFFTTTIYNRLGEGPMWSHNEFTQRCANNWYLNLAFVSNLMGVESTFFVLEAQLFVVSALLMYLISRHARLTRYTCGLLMLASIVYVAAVAHRAGMFATLLPTKNVENMVLYNAFLNRVYLSPLARMAPYFLGLIVAFCLPQQWPRALTPAFKVTVMVACGLLTVLIIWAPYWLWSVDAQLWHTLYAALHRCTWAAIVLFAAYSLNNAGDKNMRNTILSWRVFYPLSKLTYLTLLVSEPLSIAVFASLHRPIYLTAGSMILTCVGCVISSFIVAFAVDVGIARPSRHLLDLLLHLR